MYYIQNIYKNIIISDSTSSNQWRFIKNFYHKNDLDIDFQNFIIIHRIYNKNLKSVGRK